MSRQPRRPRPALNLATKVAVAHRQLVASGRPFPRGVSELSLKEQLPILLRALFGDEPAQLDHDPALINRPYRETRAVYREASDGFPEQRIENIENVAERYVPNANDALFLKWRTKADHDIKTRVRGDGAQHSDLALRRKLKRIERNRNPKRRKRKIAQRKNPWPKGRKLGGRQT